MSSWLLNLLYCDRVHERMALSVVLARFPKFGINATWTRPHIGQLSGPRTVSHEDLHMPIV